MAGPNLRQHRNKRNVSSRNGTSNRVPSKRDLLRAVDTSPLDEKGRRYTSVGDDSGFWRQTFTGARRYKRAVAGAWADELELLDPLTRKLLSKRLGEFMKCGHTVMVRECDCCGSERAGSGHFTRTCKTKACPTCAFRRAQETGDLFEAAFEQVPHVEGYLWRFFVVTMRYDPRDPDDLSAAALRSRARGAARVGKALWDHTLKTQGAALYRTIEVASKGHVHLNLLYYGPPVSKRRLEEDAAAVDCRAGWVALRDLDRDPAPAGAPRPRVSDPRGSKKSVKNAAKYINKGVHSGNKGTLDEAWLGNDTVATTIDPLLAARWEIATYRMHLAARYGALRGVQADPKSDDVVQATDDEDVDCGYCGAVGVWTSSPRLTESWIQRCHDAGFHALARTHKHAREGPD